MILLYLFALAASLGANPLVMNVLVILPANESAHEKFGLTLFKARPVIDEALEDTVKRGILPMGWLNVTFADERYWQVPQEAEKYSTVAVIQAYCEKRLDAIMGFADFYGLATAAKVTAGLGNGIPVLTTTGLASMMGAKKTYPYLTRIQGSYNGLAEALLRIVAYNEPREPGFFNYQRMTFMYHDKRRAVNKASRGREEMEDIEILSSHCYFTLYAIKSYFTSSSELFKKRWAVQTPQQPFDEENNVTRSDFKNWLMTVSMDTNVIILCASPDTVREIMLAAHELKMSSNGDYIFINIDVSTGSRTERPWERTDGNKEEDDIAKQAYKALKTISLRRSDQKEYQTFEMRVKDRAEKAYHYKNITGKEYEMNNFISAFYDAVMLYAIALNETITLGLDPRNGHNVTSRMWNRTFAGITGNVSIDANGDRFSDYSLLDYDPERDRFVEVAYYSGATNILKKVMNFHWIGDGPPKDSPVCGYDKRLCPTGYPIHVYVIAGLVVSLVLLVFVFFFLYRHYKLEQELAKMSWKIRYEDLCEGDVKGRPKKKQKRKGMWRDAPAEADPLLRSGSRTTLASDKFDEERMGPIRMRLRSSSSGATRKISAMIDRKLSIFTRKKSSPNAQSNAEKGNGGPSFSNNHIGELREVSDDGEVSPTNEVSFRLPLNDRRVSVSSPVSSSSDYRKKSSTEEDFEMSAKKSVSLKNRKMSFGALSIKSGGSAETINLGNVQVFTKTANYKGTVVALKDLKIDLKKYTKNIDLSREMLMDFKRVKDLQHEHVCRFTGAVMEHPHFIIVTEYCGKGSLEDLLDNDNFDMDKMMKFSLLHDLVKGMCFLHNSEIRSHGKLKSSNCVIDNRFVLKITDFGISRLHALEDHRMDELGEHAYYKRKFWTAPELLRSASPPLGGTPKGDVYSFAIILNEILFRRGAFPTECDKLTPQEIINRVVAKPQEDEEPFRPYSPVKEDDDHNQNLLDLMHACWSELAEDRPEFNFIRKVVRSLNKDNETSNLVDNLLKRMEQYATNLESIVEERTQQYVGEKKKVEELLHQLLPQSIADQLIGGQAVQAEHFDCVTIYFSDIVGFTSLSSMSTPMQVVTLLNDLYLAFDQVVDNFKVYKVETIGDAYMVVSGLPDRRDDHASQVAQMSVALLHRVKNFRIRHRMDEQLKLRIGMHSGSVVAGVVGFKMPRYCLFGDTVNTSSRMESNGLPLRIHVSSQTKEILDRDTEHEFKLRLRGEVEMKGKGKQRTYWLLGHKGMDVPEFGPEYDEDPVCGPNKKLSEVSV